MVSVPCLSKWLIRIDHKQSQQFPLNKPCPPYLPNLALVAILATLNIQNANALVDQPWDMVDLRHLPVHTEIRTLRILLLHTAARCMEIMALDLFLAYLLLAIPELVTLYNLPMPLRTVPVTVLVLVLGDSRNLSTTHPIMEGDTRVTTEGSHLLDIHPTNKRCNHHTEVHLQFLQRPLAVLVVAS